MSEESFFTSHKGMLKELPAEMQQRLQQLCKAAGLIATLKTEVKNQILQTLAQKLVANTPQIIEANEVDLTNLEADATTAFRDRLRLTDKRIVAMGHSLEQVAALADPVNEVIESKTLSNGLQVRKTRSPLGVIFVIFESRPNVAIESFSLAFKAGNGLLLKGGKEARFTTAKLYELISSSLEDHGIDSKCFWGMPEASRDLVSILLKQTKQIDVVIPRGGDRLIEFISEQSRIPVIKNDRGLCHIYIDQSADQAMALEIVDNAKTQRPGVCNSMETVLIHTKIASKFLPILAKRFADKKVEVRGCSQTMALLTANPQSGLKLVKATPQDWDTEYLDLIVNCRVVASEEEAISHIRQYGSRHSESIITSSEALARRFQAEVDAAAVYWNASTRFTDGFELGLGAEIGISTQKLHVRGPVGLRELTSVRWIIDGQGQVRQG